MAGTNIIFWIIVRNKFLGLYIDRKKFDKLWNICQLTFTLSHGQAAIERDFSVNKKILVENLQKKIID